MRAALPVLVGWTLALGALACEAPYQQNDAELVVAHRAIYLCDCLYSMHMDLDYCASYSSYVPIVDSFTVDAERRVVEAQVLLLWSDRARFEEERTGCIFE